jgi:hypothetical protein
VIYEYRREAIWESNLSGIEKMILLAFDYLIGESDYPCEIQMWELASLTKYLESSIRSVVHLLINQKILIVTDGVCYRIDFDTLEKLKEGSQDAP